MKTLIIILLILKNVIPFYAQEKRLLNIYKTKPLQSSVSLDSTLTPKITFSQPNTEPLKYQNKINVDFETEQRCFKSMYPRLIIPVTFLAYGIMAQENHLMKELDRSTNHEVEEHYTHPMIYDDYLQFVPAISVYGLNLIGIKGQHNLKDVTVIMATSHLLMAGTVNILKSTTNVSRPDNSARNSFPSGHTATSFVGAHILFREYIGISPYIAISGYLVSSATGTLRVLNKRHWVSDVAMGAGIGMLSVEASYLLLPVINSVLYPNAGKQKSQLAIVPSIGKNEYEMGMVYVF